MPAFWLTFKNSDENPSLGWPIEKLRDLVERSNQSPKLGMEWWRIASFRAAKIGDRVYLFKQGANQRGIIGIGRIVGGPEQRKEPSDIAGERWRALIQFEKICNPEVDFLLTLEQIEDIVPKSLINAEASGISVPTDVAVELERRLAPLISDNDQSVGATESDDPDFDPDSVNDERARVMRAIRIRRGQPVFRAELIIAYDGRCAITGCNVIDVLEAAHIEPYRGSSTNIVQNGLLLRADIHTLFDCRLIAIDPGTRKIVIAKSLASSAYAKVEGRPLRKPKADNLGPSKRSLQAHFSAFEAREKNRVQGL